MTTEDTKLAAELAGVKVSLQNIEHQLGDISGRLSTQITDHEARLRVLELTTAQVNPVERVKQIDALQKWQDGWNVRLVTIFVICAGVAGTTAWLVNVSGLIKH